VSTKLLSCLVRVRTVRVELPTVAREHVAIQRALRTVFPDAHPSELAQELYGSVPQMFSWLAAGRAQRLALHKARN
jgi:hypothetical protein